jgi:phosphate transport system substrate-binding protein
MLLVLSLVLATILPAAGSNNLVESGSTLMYPLITTWARAWMSHPGNVAVETHSTGSGQGVADVISGGAQLGISDAYSIDSTGTPSPLLQIPLAISGVQVNYNLPEVGLGHLNLTGDVLANIYSGTIRYWDDAAIRALNPTLAKPLPHHEILTFHRSDSSGTTFVFTQFLSESSAAWKSGPGFANRVHWPSGPWSQAVVGNAGALHGCEVMPYSLGYMGVSYRNRTDAARLGYAAIRNGSGSFILPTPATLRAAAFAMLPNTPDGARVSLINAPGTNSYPITNYEYAVVRTQQPDAATTEALTKFLQWALAQDGGSAEAFLSDVNFSALPANVREMAQVAIKNIH